MGAPLRYLRRERPMVAVLGVAVLWGALLMVVRPDNTALPSWRIAVFVGAAFLTLKDATDAAVAEWGRTMALRDRMIVSMWAGLNFFVILLVMTDGQDVLADLKTAGVVSAIIAALVCLIAVRPEGNRLRFLEAEFCEPDTPPSLALRVANLTMPLLAIGLAVAGLRLGAPAAYPAFVVILLAGSVPVHRPVRWRLSARAVGYALLCGAALA